MTVFRQRPSPEPVLLPGNAQHRGDRTEQQDSFGFSDLLDPVQRAQGGALAVLADGMGGHALGRAASQIAVRTFLDGYPRKPSDEPIAATLHQLLRTANDAVRKLAEHEGELDNAGTTLAAVVIHRQELYWIAVGDSRIYRYHQGRVTPLTTDHLYARELDRAVAAGTLSATDAATHPERDALTSFLGVPELDQIDSTAQPLHLTPGDRIMLCSDGLHRTLSDAELAEELARPDPQAAAEALLGRAIARSQPQQDNVTVVILGLADSGSRRSRRWLVALLGAGLLAGLGMAAGWWFAQIRPDAPPAATLNSQPATATPAPAPTPTPAPAPPPKSNPAPKTSHAAGHGVRPS